MQINRVNNNNSGPAFGEKWIRAKGASRKIANIYSAVYDVFFRSSDNSKMAENVPKYFDPELRNGPLPWHGKR